MGKKLILLAMAVAVVAAMAMPAAASALELRDAAGKVALNSVVTGVSTNTLTTNTPLGTLKCNKVDVNAKIEVNGPTSITAKGTAAETAVCEAGGEPLNVTEPTLVHLVSNGADEGLAQLSFIADVGPFECPYGGTVGFTYGTGSGNDTITMKANQTLTSSVEFCEPASGHPIFEGSYTLTTAVGGAPVFAQ